jgi:outer membrane protein OmpA-like peptidoglycan-associated protein
MLLAAGLASHLVCLVCARRAHAQTFAVDRFEPSERGSEWLANESLDLRGRLRPSFGYVMSYARNEAPPAVRDMLLLHIGGSLVFEGRWRVAVDLPLQPYAGGDAVARGGGVGDLRLGGDVRLFGEHGRAITGALGVQAWLPTGARSQWTSDGVFRARPRMMLAGDVGRFVWASQLGLLLRRESSEATASLAAGIRATEALMLGPELSASTTLDGAFGVRRTPVEAVFGVHWLVQNTARIAAGFGPGIGDGIGAPAWRATLAVEWAPGLPTPKPKAPTPPRGPDPLNPHPPDRDHDGIRDAIDVCPDVLGVPPHGCPPDADGDGVDDVADACPTVPGERESPKDKGCPDRDPDKDGIDIDVDACPDDRGPPDADPRRNGCPLAFVRESHIEMLAPIAFDTASRLETTPQNDAILAAVLGVVLKLPETRKLRVEGHTDPRGDKRLGLAHATALVQWLAEHGVDAARLTPVGIGPDRPIATNETEIGKKANRRIEIHLE